MKIEGNSLEDAAEAVVAALRDSPKNSWLDNYEVEVTYPRLTKARYTRLVTNIANYLQEVLLGQTASGDDAKDSIMTGQLVGFYAQTEPPRVAFVPSTNKDVDLERVAKAIENAPRSRDLFHNDRQVER